jgi:hypothetical protein
MRRGFEGLFALARALLEADPFRGMSLVFVIEAVIRCPCGHFPSRGDVIF